MIAFQIVLKMIERERIMMPFKKKINFSILFFLDHKHAKGRKLEGDTVKPRYATVS